MHNVSLYTPKYLKIFELLKMKPNHVGEQKQIEDFFDDWTTQKDINV